jgi:hypothetical protein
MGLTSVIHIIQRERPKGANPTKRAAGASACIANAYSGFGEAGFSVVSCACPLWSPVAFPL